MTPLKFWWRKLPGPRLWGGAAVVPPLVAARAIETGEELTPYLRAGVIR